ncbi:hypothetical protein RRG08_024835 [Elysia crispata]|uniref:Uncharacterized protein n=1 Tax=Elysia crispata TaxID=231223 RepID=A0AAE0YIZ3_9GAST|nr:hypothetical protein RRG08_024835 [Elysia crispata]
MEERAQEEINPPTKSQTPFVFATELRAPRAGDEREGQGRPTMFSVTLDLKVREAGGGGNSRRIGSTSTPTWLPCIFEDSRQVSDRLLTTLRYNPPGNLFDARQLSFRNRAQANNKTNVQVYLINNTGQARPSLSRPSSVTFRADLTLEGGILRERFCALDRVKLDQALDKPTDRVSTSPPINGPSFVHLSSGQADLDPDFLSLC